MINPNFPLVGAVRRGLRKFGLNRWLGGLMSQGGYEDRFGPTLEAQIRRGDTVWDIGANVGIYTERFLDKVGEDGWVVAFEPTTVCFDALLDRCGSRPNAVMKNLAMGAEDGVASMSIDDDPLAATHQITGSSKSTANVVSVTIRSGDSFAGEFPTLTPDVIKIDVEGHEGQVFTGLQKMIRNPRLRCLGIEVHFGLLDIRGEADLPRKMERVLIEVGFKVTWTDPSHLIAIR